MDTQENTENKKQKHMDEAAFTFTHSKFEGIMYFLALAIIPFIRKNIGVRTLAPHIVATNIVVLILFRLMAMSMTNIPFVRIRVDVHAWLSFALIYGVLCLIHIVKAHRQVAKGIPFIYTRSVGNSWLFPLWQRIPLPLLHKWIHSEQRFQCFIEPLIVFGIGYLITFTEAHNLGLVIMLLAKGLIFIGWRIRMNHLEHLYTTNDTLVMANYVSQSVGTTKHSDTGESVTEVTMAAPKTYSNKEPII